MNPKFKRAFRYIFHGIPKQITTAEVHYSQPSKLLNGKRIVITGGGRGLGAAMASKFVSEGANVLIAGRDEKILVEKSKELNCHYLCLDVNDISCFGDFFIKADEILGGIDILVNNAGISLHEESFLEVTSDTFDAQITTNFKGGMFLSQHFIRMLLTYKKPGTILFISSETGDTADNRPYGWTKAAINSMVRGLAYTYAKNSIRVNAIAPGITTSDMTGRKAEENLYINNAVNKRVYLPNEVAEVAAFMVSDISGCISGQIVTLNNAKTINFRR